MALLDKYEPGDFFDEMFSEEGEVRPHYAALFERFQRLEQEEFDQRRIAVDAAFLRQGITFTVYSDEQGTERIFPFDLIPRIIPNAEWLLIEKGLIQHLNGKHPTLLTGNREKKALDKDIEDELKKALGEFKTQYRSPAPASPALVGANA